MRHCVDLWREISRDFYRCLYISANIKTIIFDRLLVCCYDSELNWVAIMRSEYARLLGLQGAITIIGAIITYFAVTPQAAQSVAYGSSISLVGALFLTWRYRQGARHKSLDAEWQVRQAYRTAVERFVGMTLLLAIGFGLLRLAPLWMLAGFIAGQLAWLVIPVWIGLDWTRLKTKNKK